MRSKAPPEPGGARESVRVVAGAVFDGRGRVLIAERPAGKAHAGRWEFPGGKIAAHETEPEALRRELREELGIEVARDEALMSLVHDYPQRRVQLSLHLVTRWRGEPRGLDGQRLKWVALEALPQEDLLEADAPLVEALQRRGPPAR